MNKKTKIILDKVVEKFRTGEIPEAVAMASFPIPDIPSARWSFTNRTLMFLSGTGDARGFRQWKEAKRWVKKGAKAIYILVPHMKKKTDEKTGKEKETLAFFKASPVFAYEDTDGSPLDYEKITLPDLPLLDKAKAWGISVKAVAGNYRYLGYYAPERKEIAMASPEERVFFHELAHAAHQKVKGVLSCGQDPIQEIVAELTAQALSHIVGKRTCDTTGNSYRYIERYAKKLDLSPHAACLKVLGDTEKVLSLILEKSPA